MLKVHIVLSVGARDETATNIIAYYTVTQNPTRLVDLYLQGLSRITDLKSPPPPNFQVRFTPQISQYDLPPEIAKSDLPLKSVSMIYPPPRNHQVQFTPQIGEYDLPPPQFVILSTFFPLQHHALLHKGLFCERPKIKKLKFPKQFVIYGSYTLHGTGTGTGNVMGTIENKNAFQ